MPTLKTRVLVTHKQSWDFVEPTSQKKVKGSKIQVIFTGLEATERGIGQKAGILRSDPEALEQIRVVPGVYSVDMDIQVRGNDPEIMAKGFVLVAQLSLDDVIDNAEPGYIHKWLEDTSASAKKPDVKPLVGAGTH